MAAATSFVEPELLALGRDRLLEWCGRDARLEPYRHWFEDLVRRAGHTRSGEVEETLGLLADPFGGPAAPSEVTLPWLLSMIAAVVTAASGVEYCLRAFPLLWKSPLAPSISIQDEAPPAPHVAPPPSLVEGPAGAPPPSPTPTPRA